MGIGTYVTALQACSSVTISIIECRLGGSLWGMSVALHSSELLFVCSAVLSLVHHHLVGANAAINQQERFVEIRGRRLNKAL